MAGPLSRLPKVGHLPEDWEVLLLHVLYDQTNIKTTFLRLWEREVGEQERVLAVSDQRMVVFPKNPARGYVCDAMPKAVSKAFRAWMARQVFMQPSVGFYGEPHFETFKPRPDGEYKHVLHVFTMETRRGMVLVQRPMAFPVSFYIVSSTPPISKRAKLALSDPASLVDFHNYPLAVIEKMRESQELLGRANAQMGEPVTWLNLQRELNRKGQPDGQ